MTNGNESRTFYRGKPVTVGLQQRIIACFLKRCCGLQGLAHRGVTCLLQAGMPARFGDWHRVYVRYNRWAHKGHWLRIFEALADDPDFEHLMVDGSIVRVHQHGAAKKKQQEQEAMGKSRGGLSTKIHVAACLLQAG